ncbi:hypothetical protein ZIOFF_059070 [Zingiber officinale]|uniref:Uncharacterized protein n=1 Tax=Zingiber officinale TaxID=94328 RepID=A0A8J5FHH0_ZINOF|nr:hypothetical protein ZIOFF_059070 [Zingiber officinale]
MSLKGSGQGVDLGTSTRSLIRWIIVFRFPRAFPYEPLNRFPRFVFLSPRPHGTTAPASTDAPGKEAQVKEPKERIAGCCTATRRIAVLASHSIAILGMTGSNSNPCVGLFCERANRFGSGPVGSKSVHVSGTSILG